MGLTLGSLFDGIAGFPLSASRYGIATKWASEIEPFPVKVSRNHFSDMKHLGDVTKVNGSEVEPVDIISFGSPCQDMSVAGKRAGLEGERSGLFMEAVRIIKETRNATNGNYPRFAIWENVPGAFSSNNGNDFRAVLEEITEAEIPMPKSGRWAESGMVRGNGRSVAWRVLDAQYWGVPQRRKRIFLVADFRGQRAGEILFEQEGLLGNIEESRKAREEVATCAGNGIKTSSRINCQPDGISGTVSSKWAKGTGEPSGDEHYNLVCQLYDMTHAEEVIRTVEPGLSPTLNARMGTGGNQVPVLMQPTYAFSSGQSAEARSIGFAEELAPTLKGDAGGNMVPAIVFAANQRDEVRDLGDKSGALQAEPGMKQQTFIAQAFGPGGSSEISHAIRSQASKADKPSSTTYIVEPTYAIQSGTMPNKSQNGLGVAEELMYTLDTRADHAIAHAVDVRNLNETEELSGTLQAKNNGGYSLNYINPIRVPVRSEDNGNAIERNAREILFKLWQEIGTEAFKEWGIGVIASLQQKALLQQGMHERSISEEAKDRYSELENKSHSVAECDTSWALPGMRSEEWERCSSQRWGLHEQRAEQPNPSLQELSQLKAQAETILFDMWRTGEGIWILQQTLHSFQEIRRSELHKIQYCVRRLTPIETLRLQGFPDNWLDIEGASDSAKYKAVGNSVAIPCVEFIFSQIVKVLERND